MPKTKIWCCTKNNFVSQDYSLCNATRLLFVPLHKEQSCVNKKQADIAQNIVSCQKKVHVAQKKYFMSTKTRWQRTKKIFCAQKSY